MHIILTTPASADSQALVIDDPLFPIGRAEPNFAHHPDNVLIHLSRRHARLFVENDQAYIVDLGSRNGTTVNGAPVDNTPRQLHTGDRLSFAGQLHYDVSIAEQSDSGESAPQLLLEPEEGNSSLEPLLVSQFPFLVGKAATAFTRACGATPDIIAFLSRRHAHFYSRDNGVWIEDLGSTNGTRVNGVALEQEGRQLVDGDLIALGSNELTYRVCLAATEDESSHNASHTVLVSAADSFLDIFCEDEEQEAGDDARALEAGSLPPQGAPRRPGLFTRGRTFWVEVRDAFRSPGQGNGWHRWLVLGVIATVVLGTLYGYFQGKEVRQVEQLIAAGDYPRGSELAHDYLREHPEHEGMQALAATALAESVLADWLPLLESDRYQEAQAVLQRQRATTHDFPESIETLEALGWITRLQAFTHSRGTANAPIHIYRDEARIAELIRWWDSDAEAHRACLARLTNETPAFAPVNASSYSQLLSLRNEESVYLAAIDNLKAQIDNSLEAGDADTLPRVLDDFEGQYPRLTGLKELRADVQAYLKISQALEAGDQLRAAALIDKQSFNTEPFAARADDLRGELVLSPEFIRSFSEASAAWRDGQLTAAMAQLESLSAKPGGQLATAALSEKRDLIAAYARLLEFRESADYGEQLVAFYGELDPVEDRYFIDTLAPQFERHQAEITAMADTAWQNAETLWLRYRERGGIRGLLRLEEQVSSTFEEQAGLLTSAYTKADYSKQTYEALRRPLPPEMEALHQELATEAALQRRSLAQLGMVLPRKVLEEKLAMLSIAEKVANQPDE